VLFRDSPILRENSPFLAVEENIMQYNKMRESIKHIKGIELIPGDLFDVLEGYAKYRDPLKVALFSYGHLDFCKTAAVLLRDYNLYSNLQWLAKWSQLKTTFYLDISVACRCDEDKMYERFFQTYVPDIFAMCGWKVEDPRNCDTKFYKTYRDATPMANALYKMTKK